MFHIQFKIVLVSKYIDSVDCFFVCFVVVVVCFSGLDLWHMEVPRVGVKLELQLQAYTTATAMLDLSHVCKLHYSS